MVKNNETGTPDVLESNQADDDFKSNFDLLLAHLDQDSLAANLVEAYVAPGDNTPKEAMIKIIRKRINELKGIHDEAKNQ